jgi:hypothetical protein
MLKFQTSISFSIHCKYWLDFRHVPSFSRRSFRYFSNHFAFARLATPRAEQMSFRESQGSVKAALSV